MTRAIFVPTFEEMLHPSAIDPGYNLLADKNGWRLL